MKLLRQMLILCTCVGLAVGVSSSMAADAPKAEGAKEASKDLLLKGDAKCTGCHDEADDSGVSTPSMLETRPSVLSIGKTRHGTYADSRTPTCVDCHGESKDHNFYKGSGKPPKPDIQLDRKSTTPAAQRNQTCMNCHNKDARHSHWEGSAHQNADLPCTSCHAIHAAQDKVRDKKTQAQVCFTCHKEQRTQASKPSHHPVLEGKVTCSDCHSVHGSPGPKLMKRNSVVETCYTCHMEKRGPFVHSHQPVSEDCSNCHNPHGTTADNLLKTRAPFLCNTCHTPHATQPSLVKGTATGWWNGSDVTQGRACLNCHTQVHGSNNPSGVSPTPQRFFR